MAIHFLGWVVENSEVERVCFMTKMNLRDRARTDSVDSPRRFFVFELLLYIALYSFVSISAFVATLAI